MITSCSSSYLITGLLTALLPVFLISLTACAPASDTTMPEQTQEAPAIEVPANTVTNSDTKVRVDNRTTTDISPTDVFTKDSIGSTKIGDSFNPQKLSKLTSNFDRCFSAQNKAIPAADYLIIDDRVVKITINNSDITSVAGVRIGDSLSEVYAKHQDQTPEIIDSPLSGPDDNLVNVYYWSIDDGQRVGTRYDLNNDVVISISVGNDDGLMSQEGCA